MLILSSNFDCLQTLTSFSNDSCNSGSHRRFPIYSVNLIGQSSPWCKWCNQAGTCTISIHMSSQRHMYARFSLICHMTQQNNRLESCLRKNNCLQIDRYFLTYCTWLIYRLITNKLFFRIFFDLLRHKILKCEVTGN